MTEVEEKERENLDYIKEHISNVGRAFEEYGKVLCEKLDIDYDRLAAQVADHDKSKYSDEELDGYRLWFYPTEEEEANGNLARKAKFDVAWRHHFTNNAHHPEFWIYLDDDIIPQVKPMPKLYIAEMLLDWQAMSYKFGDNTYDYYQKHRLTKPFHPQTIEIVDSVIDIFKK